MRTLAIIFVTLSLATTLGDFIFVMRWNEVIGISDVAWCLVTSTSLFPLQIAFLFVPANVLFTKLSPVYVEATVFAFYISVTQLYWFLSKLMGTFWNTLLFGVTKDDFSNMYKLYIW